MNFTKTTSNDFAIITNGVDNRIEIIQHEETGYYNITKMSKLINRLKKTDSSKQSVEIPTDSNKKVDSTKQPRGIPRGSTKQDSHHWFANKDTIELINAFKKKTGLDCVQYELAQVLLNVLLELMFIDYFMIIS